VGRNAGRLIDRIRLTDRQESDPLGDDGLANHEQITTLNANTGTGVDQLEVIRCDGQHLAGGRPSSGGRASSWRAGRQVALRWEPVQEEDP
jgi:hypothetical protein